MAYLDDVTNLRKGGYSNDDIQSWSDSQAVKLRQAGFNQDEVDSYQGMKPPANGYGMFHGTTPTDKDFENNAKMMLGATSEHPLFDKVTDNLKSLFVKTGITPDQATSITKTHPDLEDALVSIPPEPNVPDYAKAALRGFSNTFTQGAKGLVVASDSLNNGIGYGTEAQNTPENNAIYQKATAFQNWVNQHFPGDEFLEKEHPIKLGLAESVGSVGGLVGAAAVAPEGLATATAVGLMATGGYESAYQSAKSTGSDIPKSLSYASKIGPVWGALGLVDANAFFSTVERSAPGLAPWIVAKGTQALRNGITFTGTNEFGDWLSSQIGKASDIPIEYKPTLQKLAVEAGTSLIGSVHPTVLKEALETSKTEPKAEETTSAKTEAKVPEGKQSVNPEKEVKEKPTKLPPEIGDKLFTFYDEKSDSFGLKNNKGETVQTDFNNPEEAQEAADKLQSEKKTAKKQYMNGYKPSEQEIASNKDAISQVAKDNGLELNNEQLDNAIRNKAAIDNIEKIKANAVVTPEKPTQEQPLNVRTPALPKGEENQPLNLGAEKEEPQKTTTINPDALLPAELKGAKPRYGFGEKQFNLNFESDVDKALYITAQKNKSKADEQYRNFLKDAGFTEEQIDQGGKNVRSLIRQEALNHPEISDTSKASSLEVAKNSHTFLFQKGEKVTPEAAEILQPVLDYLNTVAPRVGIEVKSDAIKTADGGLAYGSYDKVKNLITIALASPDQLHTAAHEALHAVKDVISDSEWKTLVKEANKQGLMDKYNIKENYDTSQQEEMVAHWFADWTRDKANISQESHGIFQKIKDIFTGLAAKLREVYGSTSAEDIFNKIRSGGIGAREEKPASRKATLKEATDGILTLLAPTTRGDLAKRTEVALRTTAGEAKLDQARVKSALDEFVKAARSMTEEQHLDLYNYMENRSKGAKLATDNAHLQAMADTMRSIYQGYRAKIEAMPEKMVNGFIEDYFPHLWAKGQDAQIKAFEDYIAQQGSARNLKSRVLPTIAEGLKFGLKLEEPNPIKMTVKYAMNMSNYIAHVKQLSVMKSELGAAYYAPGKQPEDYSPVVGNTSTRIVPASDKTPAFITKLYAPDEVAHIYNTWYSKGFEDMKYVSSTYTSLRNLTNTNTMIELGFSGYHYRTITMQAINNDVGRLGKNVMVGDWRGAFDAMTKIVNPVQNYITGNKILQQFKGTSDLGPQYETVARMAASANPRIAQDTLSDVTNHGLYMSYKAGTLPEVLDKLKSQLSQGYVIGGTAKSAIELTQHLVSDFSYPLFNKYVPAMKFGAFNNLITDWMRQNPSASAYEIQVNTNRIWDLVDSRFGEMNMENVFWNKKAKEVLNLRYRALGWDIGLVGQTGGAVLDASKILRDAITPGRKVNPNDLDRVSFFTGLFLVGAASATALQYLYTGSGPKEEKDLVYPKTGGVTHTLRANYPERQAAIGHEKEVMNLIPIPGQPWYSGLAQMEKDKEASLFKNVGEAIANRDWRNKPIYDPKSKSFIASTPLVANVAHIITGFKPFAGEKIINSPAGTHIGPIARMLGSSEAGARVVAPKELGQYLKKKGQ